MSSPLFPIFLDLKARRVLVVGGGEVARRKIAALLDAGAELTVVAPQIDAAVAALADAGRLQLQQRSFADSDLDQAWLVVAATDDRDVNQQVAQACNARRIWVNVVDDVELSRFQVPARIDRGPLQIAISSSGAAPMLARHLREQLERQFDASLGDLATLLQSARPGIRARFPDLSARRLFFERLLEGPICALLRRGQRATAEQELQAAIHGPQGGPARGRVSLLGAGPGDPGLLTLRGLRLLNQADVILHDRLVSSEVLALARRDAEQIEVGKQAGGHSVSQDAIHELMREHALAGRHVVRLKGGDGFVFGRGGEELEYLRQHRIAYEVVPGITAALACGAYAGIPLTHRDHAQSLRLVTAHCQNGRDTLDWQSLAAPNQTLAVYMGVAGLQTLRAQLIVHGRSPNTPFALVENGSRANQRVITGVLESLPEAARDHAVRSPALLILGEVAALAQTLHWFGAAPIDSTLAAVPLLASAA